MCWSLVCDKVFCAISNFKIVSLRKRELVALIYMYSSLYEYVFVYVLMYLPRGAVG